jgi:hypothetical protein
VAEVEGDIEAVDGVLRITRVRLRYLLCVPPGARERAEEALAGYADRCPAYQSVKGSIEVTWQAQIEEEDQAGQPERS